MIRCMLLFMPLACAQGKLQYQCKWTKTHEILIMVNEKPSITQISKMIMTSWLFVKTSFD